METMQTPPDEQVKAGIIARDAIELARNICKSAIDAKRLDLEIETFIRDSGGEPALKGYHPSFSLKPYEWSSCICIDNAAVHGVPGKLLGPDHIITVDLVVRCGEWHADTARTFTTSTDQSKQAFVKQSDYLFKLAVDVVDPQVGLSIFGDCVETCAKMFGIGVIKEYCGHGIGKMIHSDPQILNYSSSSTEVFQVGKAYAVEPVLAINPTYSLSIDPFDGFTVVANCLTSHNEDTIFISDSGAVNLTGKEQ
jgi:methionyl aminopeptidase